MNFIRHSSLIVSMNLSHLPFRFGEPFGRGLVFMLAILTVAVNSLVNFTSRSCKIISGFFSRSFVCSMNHSVCSQTQAESGRAVDSVTMTSRVSRHKIPAHTSPGFLWRSPISRRRSRSPTAFRRGEPENQPTSPTCDPSSVLFRVP